MSAAVRLFLSFLAFFVPHGPAWSHGAYANKPVKIIVAYAPGQATDQAARAIAQKLSESPGQQFFVVVNPSVPAGSVKERVAYPKANPGKVNFGTAGDGAANHLSSEMFKSVPGH